MTCKIPISGQSFASKSEWIARAQYVLTGHPDYNNTEHSDAGGWRGDHFAALCFDQKGRRVKNGGDFRRAEEDDAFPVWWIWPDQVAALIIGSEGGQS